MENENREMEMENETETKKAGTGKKVILTVVNIVGAVMALFGVVVSGLLVRDSLSSKKNSPTIPPTGNEE